MLLCWSNKCEMFVLATKKRLAERCSAYIQVRTADWNQVKDIYWVWTNFFCLLLCVIKFHERFYLFIASRRYSVMVWNTSSQWRAWGRSNWNSNQNFFFLSLTDTGYSFPNIRKHRIISISFFSEFHYRFLPVE